MIPCIPASPAPPVPPAGTCPPPAGASHEKTACLRSLTACALVLLAASARRRLRPLARLTSASSTWPPAAASSAPTPASTRCLQSHLSRGHQLEPHLRSQPVGFGGGQVDVPDECSGVTVWMEYSGKPDGLTARHRRLADQRRLRRRQRLAAGRPERRSAGFRRTPLRSTTRPPTRPTPRSWWPTRFRSRTAP